MFITSVFTFTSCSLEPQAQPEMRAEGLPLTFLRKKEHGLGHALHTYMCPSGFPVTLQSFPKPYAHVFPAFPLKFLSVLLFTLLPTTSRNHEVKQLPLIFCDKCPPFQLPQENGCSPWVSSRSCQYSFASGVFQGTTRQVKQWQS